MPRRIGSAVVACLALLGLAGVVVAQAAEPVGIEVLEPGPLAVKFDDNGTAEVVVTLQNQSAADATVAVSLLDLAAGEVASADSDVSLVSPTQALRLSAGATQAVAIALAGATDVDLSAFRGVLVFDPGAGPVDGTTVELSVSEDVAFSGARPQPEAVTINANRLWPSIFPFDCDCWAYWIVPTSDAARYPMFVLDVDPSPLPGPVWTNLSSDTGGRLFVSLQDFEGHGQADPNPAADASPPPAAERRLDATVFLGSNDRSGKFAGTLKLNPSDSETPTVGLTVNVQDFFVWPLLALVFGEYLAFRFERWRSEGRTKSVAEAALAAARKGYRSTKLDPPRHSWAYDLFDVSKKGAESRADAALRSLKSADTKELLTDAIEQARDVIATWAAIDTGASVIERLGQALKSARDVDPRAAAALQAENQLKSRTEGFASATDARAAVDALASQTRALESLVAAGVARERGIDLWSQLSDQARSDLSDSNPVAYWNEVVRTLRTESDFKDEGVLTNLRQRNVDILAYLMSHPDELGRAMLSDGILAQSPTLRAIAEDREAVVLSADDVYRYELEPEAEVPAVAAPPIVWRDSESILNDVRSFDRIDYATSFLVGLIASFALLYVNKNFGTGWDYLGAIATGFAATAVVTNLPWSRTYRLPPKVATA